jgi:hypothetical protein
LTVISIYWSIAIDALAAGETVAQNKTTRLKHKKMQLPLKLQHPNLLL